MKIVLAFAMAAMLGGCSKDKWMGIVYPSRDNLTNHVEIGIFSSLEQCRDAVWDTLVVSGWAKTGDYECGLNCQRKTGFGELYVCERTER